MRLKYNIPEVIVVAGIDIQEQRGVPDSGKFKFYAASCVDFYAEISIFVALCAQALSLAIHHNIVSGDKSAVAQKNPSAHPPCKRNCAKKHKKAK